MYNVCTYNLIHVCEVPEVMLRQFSIVKQIEFNHLSETGTKQLTSKLKFDDGNAIYRPIKQTHSLLEVFKCA